MKRYGSLKESNVHNYSTTTLKSGKVVLDIDKK